MGNVGVTGADGSEGAPVPPLPASSTGSPHISPVLDDYRLGGQVPNMPGLSSPQYSRPGPTTPVAPGQSFAETGAGLGSPMDRHPNAGQ
jgi:hypothetical protein